jgi:hypothetical protein
MTDTQNTAVDREGQVAWLACLLTELLPGWEDDDPDWLGRNIKALVHDTFGGR